MEQKKYLSQRSDVTIFTHKRSWSQKLDVTVLAIKKFCLRKYVTIFAIKFFWLWKLINLKGYGQQHQLQHVHMKGLLKVLMSKYFQSKFPCNQKVNFKVIHAWKKIQFVKSSCFNLNVQIFSCEVKQWKNWEMASLFP